MVEKPNDAMVDVGYFLAMVEKLALLRQKYFDQKMLLVPLYRRTGLLFNEIHMSHLGPTTPYCEGISPLGYWQKVNQSPTQTKPYTK